MSFLVCYCFRSLGGHDQHVLILRYFLEKTLNKDGELLVWPPTSRVFMNSVCVCLSFMNNMLIMCVRSNVFIF